MIFGEINPYIPREAASYVSEKSCTACCREAEIWEIRAHKKPFTYCYRCTNMV